MWKEAISHPPPRQDGCKTEFKSYKKSRVSLVAANLGLISLTIIAIFLTLTFNLQVRGL